MYQYVIVAENRVAELRTEAADERQARQAVRAAKNKRDAQSAGKPFADRARRWVTAA